MTNDEARRLLDNLGLGPARPKPARLDAFHAALGTKTIRHMDWYEADAKLNWDSAWVSEPPKATPEYLASLAAIGVQSYWFVGEPEPTKVEGIEVTEILLPEIPPPVWDERKIDADKAMAAVRALSGGR